MNTIPTSLNAAIQRYQAGSQAGSLAGKTAQMSERYRHGGRSDGTLDFNAYLTARLPATFAAVAYCLAELARRHPQFSPLSLLDAGSGPGTVSWAVAASYPNISAVTFLDNNERFLELACSLAAQSEHPALRQARALDGDINNLPPELSADFVVAAYAFAELPVSQSGKAAVSLWQACKNTLLIIEPGTPQGFARIAQVRAALMADGANLIAPCTHMNSCPMTDPDWCHFSVRLARSREHMHAKKARVPYEDEKFSYVIASRQPVPLLGARILAPPHETKAEIKFKLCTESGLDLHGVASRQKAEYKRVRKLEWGDLFRIASRIDDGENRMTRKLISSGSKFETEMAYSRAVVEGDWIFVSGTTGFNYATMEISEDVAAQAEQTFFNIKAAMEKAGFGLEHIVRVHYILPKAEDFPPCWRVLKKYLSDVQPAATMFVAGLADPRMKIEIEVTGKKRGPA